jgi:hypothetical protein
MEPDWGDINVRFDSGAHHGTSTYARPLYTNWSIPWKNIPQTKRDTILGFVNSMKAGATPFLIKHHKDFRVNSVLAASAGYTAGTSFFTYDVNSFLIRVDTTTIGSMFSSLSGWVTLGSEYNYDQDTGIMTADSIDVTDVWRIESAQYYRKAYIRRNYQETGIIEGQYTGRIVLDEVS